MHVPIIQVPWCFSVEVVTMGGGSDKGISINETLIRFPVSFGFKRLLLMQQCDGMRIVCRCGVEPVPTLCKWTRHHGFLPATTYSRGSQSWPSITSPQMETHPFLICPPLHSDCQTDTRISTHVHAHRHWGAPRVKKQKGKYLQAKVWSGPRMSWLILSSCTQFNCDFKASWTASECPQLTCLWSDMVRYSLDRIQSIWSWYLPAPYTQCLTYSCILYSVS